jgi:hypothetical protein
MPAIFVLVLFTAFAATTPQFLQQATDYAGNRLADAVGEPQFRPVGKPYTQEWFRNAEYNLELCHDGTGLGARYKFCREWCSHYDNGFCQPIGTPHG